ncbi:MAG: hypothetical protein HN833_01295 [Elusimicrobiaceae bacterium]|jgi:hypothetical protein|nr:hypothetical protein [Elusimicrobiaceae bacterium]MBT3954719.1 hypothetical protein [Elusimicrobiaceae bacterium]MBT4008627.1 hypothetical protein [Elusimicrobiaceae bacterium]MBT4402463.1 hypothetical protein [Elusimicrobiaceae bacterium]MBT4439395.1 hypothetical protein [Elusimicrobiaceae bacterium]
MKKFLFLMAIVLVIVFVYKNKKSEANLTRDIAAVEQRYSFKAIPPKDIDRGNGIRAINQSSVDVILSLRTSLYAKTKISAYDLIYSNQLGNTEEIVRMFFVAEVDANIRYAVLQNIAKYKDKDTLDILAHVVQKDGSQRNRLFALEQILKYKTPDILPILIEAKERNGNKNVRVEAAKGYETLNYDIEEKRRKKEQEIQLLMRK